MKVIKDETMVVPIKMFLDGLDDKTLEQAMNLSKLRFLLSHVAIMPDAHLGYGMPIGGVIATEGIVIPHAVGSDIGCGMCAVKTPWKFDRIKDSIVEIVDKIRAAVPLGFNIHKVEQDRLLMPKLDALKTYPTIAKHYTRAVMSLGTLGGGNHFIEIQKDKDDIVWIMLHSGSRKLGYDVADYHNRLAIELNKQWHVQIPKSYDLAYFPVESKYGQEYIAEMQYCVDYAFVNRQLMMRRIKEAFDSTIKHRVINISKMINIAHNYARIENHFGENVWVHRKGATSAKDGEMGIIPGSQGTKSYIVRGKGCRDSFMSCSHGAGRALSRKEARRVLDLRTEQAILDDQGILHSLNSEKELEEAVSAYKDIHVVMENQKDLVDIVEELSPVASIKGVVK